MGDDNKRRGGTWEIERGRGEQMRHKRVEDRRRKKSLHKEEIRERRGTETRRGNERGQGREGGEVTRGEKRRGRGGGVKTTR